MMAGPQKGTLGGKWVLLRLVSTQLFGMLMPIGKATALNNGEEYRLCKEF